MPIVRLALVCALLGLLPIAASGQPAASPTEWINALRQGGHVIVFRHGATYSDQADTDPLNPKNVAKQRQLNDNGRALAKSIGESMHKLRIPVAQVQTSMFQRAVDTAHCWASAKLWRRLISLKAVSWCLQSRTIDAHRPFASSSACSHRPAAIL